MKELQVEERLERAEALLEKALHTLGKGGHPDIPHSRHLRQNHL
jgi:hypothetical protein